MSRRPRKYLIDDIRSRFQTVALDNKYQIFIEPNLDVYNASADVGVERRFIDEDLGLYVSDAVLPGSSFADIEVSGDRQGITERMPFKRIYDDVTFTFMVDRYYKVMRFFEAWTQLINPLHGQVDGKANNQVMTLNYPKDYKCTLSVAKFNKDYFNTGVGFLYYCFIKAWPLSVSSAPINYDSGSVLKLNVTFRYERYVMENVNRGRIRSGWKGYSDSFDPWMGRYNEFDTPYIPPKDKTTVKSATDLMVERDNRIYGNTMPTGAFNITSKQSNLYSGLKGFKTEPQYDAYGSYYNGQLPGGNDPLRFKNKEYKRNNLNQNLP